MFHISSQIISRLDYYKTQVTTADFEANPMYKKVFSELHWSSTLNWRLFIERTCLVWGAGQVAVENISRQKSLIAFTESCYLPWARSTGPDFPSSVAALALNWPDDPKIGLFPPVTNWACHRCILAPRCAARYHFPQTLWQIGPNESTRATKRAYGGRTLRSSRNALSRAIRAFSLQTSVTKKWKCFYSSHIMLFPQPIHIVKKYQKEPKITKNHHTMFSPRP